MLAGSAHESDAETAGNVQVQTFERQPGGRAVARAVSERHVVELNGPVAHRERPAKCMIGYLGFEIEKAEDSLDRRHRRGNHDRQLRESFQGQIEKTEI